ncbi:hypothetical protein [Tissierella sp.]|uniref:hypothetical protein n=1 Tax=Tissierella sp. TaxID=41274 RepID=UPI0030251492
MRIISPSLLNKLKDKNQTPFNKSDPKMNISLARARSSIMDSSYFTVETIRTKPGIGDISIGLQRLKPYGPPSAIYEIHIDNGIGKTAIRKYPDKRKEGWMEQFELGAVSSVAICFDGRWIKNSKGRWQIVTKEKPYIFYVRTDNKLYVKLWDEVEEKLLAENVKKVKVIRGWKSAVVGKDDHGLIAAYIKTDGKVYYRNYSEQEDGKFVWENERQMTEFSGTAINLNLFITNDYRTGIIIEDNNGKITWLITNRNWAGMAIATDKILARNDIKVNFIETTKYKTFKEEKIVASPNITATFLYASSFNKFVEIKNLDNGEGDYGKEIIFTVLHEIYDIDVKDFELRDNRNISFVILDILKIGDRKYKLMLLNFNNAEGEVALRFKGLYGKNEAGNRYDEFKDTFIPANLVPLEIPIPTVEAIWNE